MSEDKPKWNIHYMAGNWGAMYTDEEEARQVLSQFINGPRAMYIGKAGDWAIDLSKVSSMLIGPSPPQLPDINKAQMEIAEAMVREMERGNDLMQGRAREGEEWKGEDE